MVIAISKNKRSQILFTIPPFESPPADIVYNFDCEVLGEVECEVIADIDIEIDCGV